jgi:hypothetical protein
MRCILLIASLLALLSGALLLVDKNWNKPRPKFKVGQDTTLVTEPLDAEGFIDFETALNTRLRGKSTPETNAVVLLFQVTGPKPEGGAMPADFYRWLGVDAPPAEGEYLKSHFRHFQNEIQGEDPQSFHDFEAALRRRPWGPEDSPRHAEWLKLNEKPLALAVEATRRPDYFHPLISRKADGSRGDLVCTLIPLAQKCREIGSALALRATLKLGAGKIDEAFEDVLAVHRLARLVSRGGTLIELLVGIALQSIAHQTEAAIFEHGAPTAEQAMTYQRELHALPPMASVAEKVALFERFMLLDVLQAELREKSVDEKSVDLWFFDGKQFEDVRAAIAVGEVDLATTLRFSNGWFDRFEAALRRPTRPERRAAIAELDEEFKRLGEEAKHPASPAPGDPDERREYMSERVGAVFVHYFSPNFTKLTDAADGGEQTHRNALILTALGGHFADEKKYPEKLTDLVPKYLKELPGDVFSGKDLIYARTEAGYLFYSVGPNGKDDGGRLVTDEPRGDDVGVRVPRK